MVEHSTICVIPKIHLYYVDHLQTIDEPPVIYIVTASTEKYIDGWYDMVIVNLTGEPYEGSQQRGCRYVWVNILTLLQRG